MDFTDLNSPLSQVIFLAMLLVTLAMLLRRRKGK
ncbi:MYXO-CTERM sorting domain-containing protein [Nakamurella antarctica]|nr:MYXO-CTERM sorting domain-containing protein [Nakamurella antarctica]